MIRRLLILATALLALALLWKATCGAGSTPDAKLAHHIDRMCEIAGDHVGKPRKGVDKLFRYLGRNTEKMGAELGALLVEIEQIEDDAAHDRRAREAARLIHSTTARCESTFQRFFAAVERDPEAKARFERGVDRLGRTLQILLGNAHHVAVPGLIAPRADHVHR